MPLRLNKSPAVYRHFAHDGRLLYVGKSVHPTSNRLKQHRAVSFWFKEITTITIEHFESDLAASVAEKDAIRRERPLYNKVHSSWAPQPKPLQVNGMRGALSDRERQVLDLLDQGKRVSQIAEELKLSVKTVSTYRSRIIEKLNMPPTSTVALVLKARGLKLFGEADGAR